MDRNSAIGLTLIAVVLLAYFTWFSPQPPVENPTTAAPAADTLKVASPAPQKPSDSTVNQAVTIEKKTAILENENLRITLSNTGAIIEQAELKNFKTYYGKPLYLITPNNNSFSMQVKVNGKDTDLHKLYYEQGLPTTKGDTTFISYTAQLGDNQWIRHVYGLASKGFIVSHTVQSSGLTDTGDAAWRWNSFMLNQEKDIKDVRTRTTINYFAEESFEDLPDASTSTESEAMNNVKWVAFKQKFFIAAALFNRTIPSGNVQTTVNVADTTIIKTAEARLTVPGTSLLSGSLGIRYFFGPTDYNVITEVPAESFSKNLSLGWPPVVWVNKYVILPLFSALEKITSNYGLIILILVIIIKLLLTPLTYSSYLGMAKMRLLKPELDLIKEKNGDNMAQAQQDQMKLYSEAGVNPFSGCIPLLLQMPILFAMFYFFPVAIQLRQQPFLWAEDLSTWDSVLQLPFVIPFYGDHVSLFVFLMTISNLIYIWQNNQLSSVTGPMKSVSYIMPVIFMFVLNSFSAGLSFYYFVSNLVTFAQQAIIKRFVDEEKIKQVMADHKKKMQTGTKKGSFMTRLEEAMKASEEAKKNKRK